MNEEQNTANPRHESATFYVPYGKPASSADTLNQNVSDDFERVLDEYCEPPAQCYRFYATGEVNTVFTSINKDGTATNKRRRVTLDSPGPYDFRPLETSRTRDGYGVEFVLKRTPEANMGVQSNSEQQIPVHVSPGIARTRTRRFRLGRKRRVLFARKNDMTILKERIESHRRSIVDLTRKLGENPYIRCEHWYHDGRTFAFASVYIRKGAHRKAVVALLWQTRTRPHRAVCVTFSLQRSEESDECTLNAICSCCHLFTQQRGSDGGCYHAQVSLADDSLTRVVKNEIRRRETIPEEKEEDFSIFGEPFILERSDDPSKQLTVLLDRGQRSTKTLASSWLFFITFDIDLFLFTPVLKVKGKPFKCLLCRVSSSRRGICSHEDCARSACKSLRGQPGTGSGLLSDLGILSGNESDVEQENDIPLQQPERENGYGNDIGNRSENRSVSVPKEYTTHERRPILPCLGEWNDMLFIAKALKNVKEGETLVLDERNLTKCHECGLVNNKENYEGYARDLQLFTLFQGTHRIRVYDWYCHICDKRRYFSGYRLGVFPAQQNSAFTTELMYQWVEMTCSQGYSFRNAYQTTRVMQRAASMQMKPKNRPCFVEGNRLGTRETLSSDLQLDSNGTHRRRANDALRAFVKLLDTNSQGMTQNFFSCNNCELPLTATDCAELGISEDEGRSMKRLRAVVIDGTASGILTELPEFERNDMTVPGPRAVSTIHKSQKLLKKNPHRKALKKFFKNVKRCFRQWKNPTEGLQREPLRVWIEKSDNISIQGIQDPEDTLSRAESRILQLLLSAEPCFCPKNDTGVSIPQRTESGHSGDCERLRTVFKKTKESQQVIDALRALFHVSGGNAVKELHGDNENSEVDEDRNTLQSNHGTPGNTGMNCFHNNGDYGQSNDNHDELMQNDSSNDDAEQNIDSNDDNETAVHSMTGSDSEGDEDDSSENDDIYDTNENQRRKLFGVWTTLAIPEAEKRSQFVESTLLLLEFLLTDNVSLPYVGAGSPVELHEENSTPPIQRTMLGFTKNSLSLHADLICALQGYTNPCTETCRTEGILSSAVDCPCVLKLKEMALRVCKVNPVLGTFCQEVIKLRKPMPSVYQSLITSFTGVLKCHAESARKYFEKLEKRLSKQCKLYWRDWADPKSTDGEAVQVSRARDIDLTTSSQNGERNGPQHQHAPTNGSANGTNLDKTAEEELKEAELSGICFPGRKRVRPCIVFKSKNEDGCNKNYKSSKSHSPGLLTVQCACDSPKLLGFVVMTQAESVSMALSAVLSHFRIFPKTVYYDNACNLFLSAMLRAPWVLGRTRFLVDRFHFKSHTCSSCFDPDAYAEFDSDYTETAESINARIEKTLHQIRYLRGGHLVPYLRARFSFINLAATFRAMYHKDDLEDVDMTQFFQQTLHCSCIRCKEERNAKDDEVNGE